MAFPWINGNAMSVQMEMDFPWIEIPWDMDFPWNAFTWDMGFPWNDFTWDMDFSWNAFTWDMDFPCVLLQVATTKKIDSSKQLLQKNR